MEVQITDFENAAFAVFIVLVSRAILKFNLNFYIPISKVICISITVSSNRHLPRSTRTCKEHNAETPRDQGSSIFGRMFMLFVGVEPPVLLRHQDAVLRRKVPL